jgi:hypothetical protein
VFILPEDCDSEHLAAVYIHVIQTDSIPAIDVYEMETFINSRGGYYSKKVTRWGGLVEKFKK